jgi:predicted N-acyltransferase
VRRAEPLADWQSCYRLYEQSLERWAEGATMRYEWAFFALLAAMRRDEVKLWIASRQGQDLAGALCLPSRRCSVFWHGAAASEAFPVRAVHAAYYEAIVDACESGAKWFDMNPSHGLPGVEHFKRGFGTLSLLSPVYDRMAGWRRCARIVGSSRQRVAESMSNLRRRGVVR